MGLKGFSSVIDGDLKASVKVESATWVIEDNKSIVISMEKVNFYYFLKFLLMKVSDIYIFKVKLFLIFSKLLEKINDNILI